MGSLSNYVENEVLDHALKTGTWAQPTNLYIALSTADPTDDGSGLAEPVGNGYARVQHNTWDVAAARATENTGTVSFPEASGAWGTITHFAIMDALTGGNMIGHGALSASKDIGPGDNASFQDGAIDVTFSTGGISTFLANALLDHIFKNTAYDPSATSIYGALSTANPTDDGSGVAEPSGGAYTRIEHTAWDVAAAGASQNTGAITFPQATASWGTVTHFMLYDASTVGNMLYYGTLDNARSIGVNDTPSFAGGALDIIMD